MLLGNLDRIPEKRHRIGKFSAAKAAYERAHELDPNNSGYAKVLEGWRNN